MTRHEERVITISFFLLLLMIMGYEKTPERKQFDQRIYCATANILDIFTSPFTDHHAGNGFSVNEMKRDYEKAKGDGDDELASHIASLIKQKKCRLISYGL